LEGGWMLHPTS